MPDVSPSGLAVLGLVAIRPASGYELVAFTDRSIAYFWSIPRSHLYRELARLEGSRRARSPRGLALIAGTHVSQTSAPDKRVYEITVAGRALLAAWVESPAVPTAKSKNGFLLKVFMARHTRPDALEPMLRSYRESVELELADLQAIVDQLADRRTTVSQTDKGPELVARIERRRARVRQEPRRLERGSGSWSTVRSSTRRGSSTATGT